MLLDSNIIIYAVKPEHDEWRQMIVEQLPFVSAISYVEVLGYHRLTEDDRRDFESLFQMMPILPLTTPVIEQAVALRQMRKLSLGDALVAATALLPGLTLVTHNTKGFRVGNRAAGS